MSPVDAATAGPVVLTFDLSDRVWFTSNDRLHWRARARKTRELREIAAWTARAQHTPRFVQARVVAHVSYPTNGRADPGNVVGTVLKALVDGLVDAGVFPDDDHEHVIGPDPRRGLKTGKAGLWRVRLEIHELTATEEDHCG